MINSNKLISLNKASELYGLTYLKLLNAIKTAELPAILDGETPMALRKSKDGGSIIVGGNPKFKVQVSDLETYIDKKKLEALNLMKLQQNKSGDQNKSIKQQLEEIFR